MLREYGTVSFSYIRGNEAFNDPLLLNINGANSFLIQIGATQLAFMAQYAQVS